MSAYKLWNIYGVLQRFIEVRGMTPLEEYICQDEFNRQMRDNEIVLIKCQGKDGKCLIVLTNADSDIPGKKQNFEKMINKIRNILRKKYCWCHIR